MRMHHAAARAAVTHLLESRGFGERGLTLTYVAACNELDSVSKALRVAGLAAASALPVGEVTSYMGELLYAPIPTDGEALCRQLAPITIELAKNTGFQLACLACLVDLWPHISSSERALMRQRYLDGLTSDHGPDGMHVSAKQLEAWQRDFPTSKNGPDVSVASLQALLNEPTPKDAYRVMSEHLGINAHMETVSWVLGSLAVQVRLRYQDPDSYLLHVLLGSVALERIASRMPPEHLATLMSQLGHQLWWCMHGTKLPAITPTNDDPTGLFHKAIASGDAVSAQRSARRQAQRPAEFWDNSWSIILERILANDPKWPQALALVLVTTWRTNADVIPPDDAAVVGTVLADFDTNSTPQRTT